MSRRQGDRYLYLFGFTLHFDRKNFIARNDAFTCEHCRTHVSAARGTSRNHCPACLTSKHVDSSIPGDRSANCRGLMPAIRYEGTDPGKLDLVHQCQRCGKISRNRTAPDEKVSQLYR
ncbi:MAG: RNHCP domain protein [Candidatus Andersenbacteria bacterium CG10_big_fil_rev_8_21_14_0_10_54_11]|uniref:RNHCP domain protein n=1 Tax=Candidatus Andersenbacteria bacterium CG10_big_fil_rev_8_21_14_0_10_54_11 TaxID=1974485 RepID=A0A2M6WZF6_9BACT|nr:MAG: RNHCP domain protein [Candidatus Andersenbacteria bacterium CG10_big_fil_rev_8_21_14_0_10_54_11]